MGCNTWDLMDKSRDLGARPEVQSRLDAMKTGGWTVGRTWGFSLGTGLVNSPVGQVVSDPTKILETAPGRPFLHRYFVHPQGLRLRLHQRMHKVPCCVTWPTAVPVQTPVPKAVLACRGVQ